MYCIDLGYVQPTSEGHLCIGLGPICRPLYTCIIYMYRAYRIYASLPLDRTFVTKRSCDIPDRIRHGDDGILVMIVLLTNNYCKLHIRCSNQFTNERSVASDGYSDRVTIMMMTIVMTKSNTVKYAYECGINFVYCRRSMYFFGCKAILIEPGAFKTPIASRESFHNSCSTSWNNAPLSVKEEYGPEYATYG